MQLLRRGSRLIFAVSAALFFTGCAARMVGSVKPLPPEAIPPVIAVSSFENRSGFTGQWKLGSGMADLLVSELVASRNFVVVERKHLASIVRELQLQRSEGFRDEGKVDTGRLKNAEYLVRGVINDFSQVGGGSFAIAVRTFLFGGRGYKARVALTLTIVDVESGEIVDSVQCAGIAKARQAYAKGEYKNVAFGGDAFFRTPLGIATANAIRRGVRGIVHKAPKNYWTPMVCALGAGGAVIINGGSDRGLQKGKMFEVREKGTAVTDPGTGDVLSVIPGRKIAVVRVKTVKNNVSYCETVEGGDIKRGQLLKELRQ
ncbi:MAG: CsgG/HfaB family protein [Verrucomicrobiota bacterium]